MRHAALLFAVSGFLCGAPPTLAADYPTRPLRFVVCTPPSGPTDVLARLAGDKLSQAVGQAVVVENKPGAAGRIAAQDVLKSPADGYTAMFCGIQIVTMPLFFKDPGYELGKDLVTDAVLLDSAGTIGISSKVPAKNLKEFIAYAKANPGKLNYVSYGNHHVTLAIEAFMGAEGFSMVPIPFTGSAPMLTAMSQGDIHFGVNTVNVFKPLVDKGQIRLIATVGAQRTANAPDLPTAAEQGYSNFIVPAWFGAWVRGGTPRDAMERLNRELNAAIKLPDVRPKLEAFDGTIMALPLEEVDREVQSKFEFFSKVASRLKIDKQ